MCNFWFYPVTVAFTYLDDFGIWFRGKVLGVKGTPNVSEEEIRQCILADEAQ